MDDIKAKTSYGWVEFTNYAAATEPDDTLSTRCGLCFIDSTLNYWNGSDWAEFTGSGGATTFVGLTDTPSAYTSAANKILKVNTGGTAVEFVTVSGDVTIGATGTTAIAAGVIVNADVKSDAAIALSKLATVTASKALVSSAGGAIEASAVTATELGYVGSVTSAIQTQLNAKLTSTLADGKVFVGNGTDEATAIAISGDVAMTNLGATTVTDLTIASEAEGDILYNDGTNWVRLAAGTSGKFLKTQGAAAIPMWDSPTVGYADALKSPFTIEGGTYDPATTVTAQTSSAAALTIPDLAGVAQEWVFSAKAQTLTNKTLTSATLTTPIIVTTGSITDAGGDAYLTFVENASPTDSIQITQGATGGGATIEAITSDTDANLILGAAGTGDVAIANGTELTFTRATQDALIVVADQTGEDHTFNVPDIATGASDTFAFLAEAQTFTNKTLTSPTLTTPKIVTTGAIVDASGDEYLKFVADTTPVTYIQITSGDTTVAPMLEGAGETNTDLMLKGSGTGDVVLTDGGDITAQLIFELDGMTTSTSTTFTVSQTDDRVITLPDATDTLVGKATTDTFTNKTFDCDGSGNALSNVNATELDPVGDAAFGIPFVMKKTVADLAAAGTNIVSANPKMQILQVWFVASSADAGTIVVHSGQVGSIGNAISNTITSTTTDKALIYSAGLDDAEWSVSEDAGLVAVGDEGASLDGTIFVMAVRID